MLTSAPACLSNGLCWDPATNHILRGGCTDSSFGEACPGYCVKDKKRASQEITLRHCNGQDVLWTCNANTTNCDNGFTVPAGYIDDRRNIGENGNVIYAKGNESDGSAGASTGDGATLRAGLGAGLGVGLPLLLALAVSLWYLRRARQELKQLRSPERAPSQARREEAPLMTIAEDGGSSSARHTKMSSSGNASSTQSYAASDYHQTLPVGQVLQPTSNPVFPTPIAQLPPAETAQALQELEAKTPINEIPIPDSAVQTPAEYYKRPGIRVFL